MATNNMNRLPIRPRVGAQRIKIAADENAVRHGRQSSAALPVAGASRPHPVPQKESKLAAQRPILHDTTTTAVNRNKDGTTKATGKDKEGTETGLKRSRSSSLALATGVQRVPVGPGRTAPVPAPAPAHTRTSSRSQKPSLLSHARRVSRVAVPHVVEPVVAHDVESEAEEVDEMEVEEHAEAREAVEAMHGASSDVEEETEVLPKHSAPCVWPEFSPAHIARFQSEIDAIKSGFDDEVDLFDTTMVSEYSDEIFDYMCELEDEMMPSAEYMSGQTEITWAMRQTLVDWLLQVHLRYHMLPETLWIAINVVDRFLTKRVVSLVKLQLVGVTAMFVAAKYEEILAPSVDEFVFMTENGYSREEILKGERIVLQTLDFRVSHYCSPYSWMRRISKADDYDIQTRTLSKFLTEATLLDHRFLKVKPSMVAAVGMYTARRMLGGDWNDAFVFYSGYTEEQLEPGHNLLTEKLLEPGFSSLYVCKKYGNKKFLKASIFAIEWAKNANFGGAMLEE